MGTGNTIRRGMGFGTLIPFIALAFGLTWGLAALFVLFPDQIEAIFGELSSTHPLFILAVYSPGIAGVLLVWRHYGVRGLGSFFRRLALWRMPLPWWGFLVIGVPALYYLAAAIEGTIADPFPFSPWYGVLPALVLALFLGPIEEFGWRGVALPLLQRRFAPLWASLILGGIWGLWHVPAFLLSGTPQEAWSFGPFFFGAVALSVIMTSMFNAARGSILIPALLHFQLNNPIWPDAPLWATVVFAVAAVAVVALNRNAMLSREGAVTGVLMPGEEGRSGSAHVAANR
jgi:uncharacterized protein